MKAIRVLWVDGRTKTKDGNGTAPRKLALHKDADGSYRWFGQGYNACGIFAGPCTIETWVSASTVDKAIEAAWAAWGRHAWRNLRTTRTTGRA
jgi:hypothetical protein